MDSILEQIRDWPLAELESLRDQVDEQVSAKRLAEDAPRQMDWLIQEYQSAVGRRPGEPWQAPTDPLCSYPQGATAEHAGALYRSTKHMNMTEPGTDPEAWVAVQDGENE